MRLKKLIQRFLIVAVAAVTMAFAAAATAESGCHRGGCAPPEASDSPNVISQLNNR